MIINQVIIIKSSAEAIFETLTKTILDFCIQPDIYPTVDEFPFEKINESIDDLEEGKAPFRIVLKH
ncbi:MAG: putative zinc-type alcohol dehydrogenase-like protein [Flavobacteriaceae bacterium]|jgi:uncharacterized zinc-type alcohol dehydrogenase-like protein